MKLSKTLRIRKVKERDRQKKLSYFLIFLLIINAVIIIYLSTLLIPKGLPGLILLIFLFILSIPEIVIIFHYANKYSDKKFRKRYSKSR